MDEPAELARIINQLMASGPVEVFEDGEPLAELSGMNFDVRREGKHTLVHFWSDERNLVRRVLRAAAPRDGQLVLEVQRFGRSKPGKLELVVVERQRPESRLSRERFRARFRRLLAEAFPDDDLESLTVVPDLEHSFSGSYARGVLKRGGRRWAVMAVSGAEDPATVDAILTFGLVWLDYTRQRAERTAVAGLRLFVPEGASGVTAHRLQAVLPLAGIELYEVDQPMKRTRPVDVRDAGNLLTKLTPRREVEQTLAAAEAIVNRIRALHREAIDAVVPPGTREVALRFRGLEFARWHNGQVHYGLPESRCLLSDSHWPKLMELVKGLANHRNPKTQDGNHPLFRAQGERWLEAMLLGDATRLDAHLDPAHLYSQVPAFSAGDRGVLDLLGVTRDGRLTVVELKVSEDLHLVLQAVDYWLRVRWHLREGDFARYGYFTGRELQHKAPRLYLVAPGLRFHSATEIILRYLIDEIEITRIGLNENWRKGLQVVFRRERGEP